MKGFALLFTTFACLKCQVEKLYCKFKPVTRQDLQQKTQLRKQFQEAQRIFDKRFRYFKRKYKASIFEEFSTIPKNNPNLLWQKLKSLSEPKPTKVVLEITQTSLTD